MTESTRNYALESIPDSDLPERVFGQDKDSIKRMKAAIEAADGQAVLLMHPFAESNYLHEHQGVADKKRHLKVESQITRMLSRMDRVAPIFILEEGRLRGLTSERLKKLGKDNLIPIIPTDPLGNPLFDFVSKDVPQDGFWGMFIRSLKMLGVRKIRIGGMYFSRYIEQCVNRALLKMRSKFDDVTLSSFIVERESRNRYRQSMRAAEKKD